MSVNQLDEALTELLRKRGRITAPGRLECHIAPMLKLGKKSSGYRKAAMVLDRAECQNSVTITWHGAIRKAVELFDPTINPKDDPEVTVRIEEEIVPMQEVVVAQDERNSRELSLLEQLNKALKVLQDAADTDDSIHGPINPIIVEKLGVTSTTARKLSTLLDKLGLRQLVGPRRSPVYMIDKTVETVTQTMLDGLSVQSVTDEVAGTIPVESVDEPTEQAAPEAEVCAPSEETKPGGVIAKLTQQAVQLIDPVDVISLVDDDGRPPIEQMADLLESSYEINQRLREDKQRLQEDKERLEGTCDNFERELGLARDENAKLRERLQTHENLSPRVVRLMQLEPSYS